DLRMACLEQARGELAAFVEALGGNLDGKSMDLAVTASARALDLSRCQSAAALQATAPRPQDPETARVVNTLSQELDRLQAEEDLGHVKSAVARARTLMPEGRATAFAPLAVRALLLSGTLEARAGDVEGGIDILYQAARAASATHDDVAYARALTELIRPVGVLRGRVDEAARII